MRSIQMAVLLSLCAKRLACAGSQLYEDERSRSLRDANKIRSVMEGIKEENMDVLRRLKQLQACAIGGATALFPCFYATVRGAWRGRWSSDHVAMAWCGHVGEVVPGWPRAFVKSRRVVCLARRHGHRSAVSTNG